MKRKDQRRRRKPAARKRRKKRRAGCRSFFILLILVVLVAVFVKKRNVPEEEIADKNPLTGHGREEEVDDKLRQRRHEQASRAAEDRSDGNTEDPVFGTEEKEHWIHNIELATEYYPNAQIILDHQEELPDPLLRLAGNNYSAIDFVAKTVDSSVVNDYEYPMNLNGGKIPYYIQWDERWGRESYAGGIIGYTGCGPTSSAMVVSGILGDESITPDVIAEISENNGFSNANGTSWNLYPFLGQKFNLDVQQIGADYDKLKAHLDTGNPALVSVGPGDFTAHGHVMVIVGTDIFGRIILNDPNNRENSEARWKWEDLEPQIKTIWTVKKAGE